MAQFRNDPLGFVLWAYPWGHGDLKDEYPDRWQIKVMETIRLCMEKNEGLPPDKRIPIQLAVASGHGIGKTALIAWLNHWFISTHPHPQIVTTANTARQLESKTWRELSKWHKLSVHKHLFEWKATKFFLVQERESWVSNAIPWSKHNTEGFAGTHEKYLMYLFDEGSAIEDAIYDVSEGAMTTECCIWVVFGNPTRNTGRFRACFGKFRHRWITMQVDSRTARKTNKDKIQQWIDDYGIDSDFVRVRVLGKFPRQASNQLISEEAVDRCMNEFEALGYEFYPIAVTCDVARFGDDMTTIGVMQGSRKLHEITGYSKKNTVEVATLVAEAYRWYHEKFPRVKIHCYIDDIGVGGGVTDILQSWGIPTTGVNSGARADEPEKFLNKRAEMWWRLALAIKAGIQMPTEERLKDDLINIEYFMTPNGQKIQLEAVRDLKERDLPSPDYGTALALAFAYPQTLDIIDTTRPTQTKGGGSTTMAKRKGAGYGRSQKGSKNVLPYRHDIGIEVKKPIYANTGSRRGPCHTYGNRRRKTEKSACSFECVRRTSGPTSFHASNDNQAQPFRIVGTRCQKPPRTIWIVQAA